MTLASLVTASFARHRACLLSASAMSRCARFVVRFLTTTQAQSGPQFHSNLHEPGLDTHWYLLVGVLPLTQDPPSE